MGTWNPRSPMRAIRILMTVALLLAGSAHAASFNSAPGAALADGVGDVSPTLDSIDTSATFGAGFMVTDVSIDVMLDHSWVGDIAVTLFSPDGTELQVMARPGSIAADEATGNPFGDSSNLSSANPITFSDLGAASAETLGSCCNNNTAVPASSFTPDADGWSTDVASFAGFDNETAGGLWTLRVGDYANFDTGTLVEWNLHLTAVLVPEPSTGALLALGLVGLAIASRRRPGLSRP